MLIPDRRVAEVAATLAGLPDDLDRLDTVEMIVELEDEYGAEAVRLAILFLEAAEAGRSRRRAGPDTDQPSACPPSAVARIVIAIRHLLRRSFGRMRRRRV